MRRIDVGMAEAAWAAALQAKEPSDPKLFAEFRSRANALPAMLQMAGLAAAMAFLASKRDDPACKRLAGHLARRLHAAVEKLPADPIHLAQHLSKLTRAEYARATVEARMYSVWLHRAVEALREGDGTNPTSAPKKDA